jgi:hypothetical protein
VLRGRRAPRYEREGVLQRDHPINAP